ncbi:flagellar hook-length control protein FliK [Vibrio rotiferianus]|uniref:flagellar hook-length control protein FliK n=1 Tax=Vibrio rotiferianus TaxID=190895 RepID=UPI00406A4104
MINVQSLVGSTSPKPLGTTKIGQSTVDQPPSDPSIAFGQYVQLSHTPQAANETMPEKVGYQEDEDLSENLGASIQLPSVQNARDPEASDISELALTSEQSQKLNFELKNDSSSLPYKNDLSAIALSKQLFTSGPVTLSQSVIKTSISEGTLDNSQRAQLGSFQAIVNGGVKPAQAENPAQLSTSSMQTTLLTTPSVANNVQPVEVTHTSNTGTLKASASGTEWASMQIDTKAGKWGEQMMQVLHDRVTLQAQQNMQEAKIRLDPPELGKLDLLVRVEGDRLNVQINANTAATREALVQISERLRAELQQQNFVHVDVNVGSDQGKGQPNHHEPQEEAHVPIFSARESSNGEHAFTTMSSEHWLNTQA